MTLNVSKITNTNMSASITGIAGPAGSTNKKPIGLVYLGIKKGNKITVKKFFFRNRGRLYIQRKAANKCLSLILNILK